MRVGRDKSVAGEMFANRRHAVGAKTATQRGGEMGDRARVAVKCAIADHRARAVVKIEHGREAEVDAVRRELASDDPAQALGLRGSRGDIAIPELAERAHRRNGGEAIAKALHSAALVIDGDEQWRFAQRADRRGELRELLRRGVVASEQNHGTD